MTRDGEKKRKGKGTEPSLAMCTCWETEAGGTQGQGQPEQHPKQSQKVNKSVSGGSKILSF